MDSPRHLHFEWDDAKAVSNEKKHGVPFTVAATAFRDPMICTMFDEDHSESEERWIALGMSATGEILVVVHLWTETDPRNIAVRVISARRAVPAEIAVYRNLTMNKDDDMKEEYDFTRAERGKHYAGANATLHIPVYLQEDVQEFLLNKAQSKGVDLDRLANDILKRDIEAFRALD